MVLTGTGSLRQRPWSNHPELFGTKTWGYSFANGQPIQPDTDHVFHLTGGYSSTNYNDVGQKMVKIPISTFPTGRVQVPVHSETVAYKVKGSACASSTGVSELQTVVMYRSSKASFPSTQSDLISDPLPTPPQFRSSTSSGGFGGASSSTDAPRNSDFVEIVKHD